MLVGVDVTFSPVAAAMHTEMGLRHDRHFFLGVAF